VLKRRVAPEIELMGRLAGSAASREHAGARIVELAARVDQEDLARALDQRRLLPLIGTRAIDAAPRTFSGGFAATVDRSVEQARRQAFALEALTSHIVDRLGGAGVRTLPLKGPLLARRLHGDAALRSAHDIDLLVSPEHLGRAVAIAQTEGYRLPHDVFNPDGMPDLHFELRHARLAPVELHWRVHWYEDEFSRDLLLRSRPGAEGLLAPDPLDDLAAALAFFARDGFHGLRHAADIAAWWDLHGPARTAAVLDGHAAAYPALARPLRAAALAAERYVGVPAAGLVSPTAEPDARGRRAVRLGAWTGDGDPDQLSANISLVDGLLLPAGPTRAFVQRELLPPATVLLPYGADAPGRLHALRLRLAHAAKTLGRFGLALWAVRGGREWEPPPAFAGAPADARNQSRLPA
jgi:hypothetical protein